MEKERRCENCGSEIDDSPRSNLCLRCRGLNVVEESRRKKEGDEKITPCIFFDPEEDQSQVTIRGDGTWYPIPGWPFQERIEKLNPLQSQNHFFFNRISSFNQNENRTKKLFLCKLVFWPVGFDLLIFGEKKQNKADRKTIGFLFQWKHGRRFIFNQTTERRSRMGENKKKGREGSEVVEAEEFPLGEKPDSFLDRNPLDGRWRNLPTGLSSLTDYLFLMKWNQKRKEDNHVDSLCWWRGMDRAGEGPAEKPSLGLSKIETREFEEVDNVRFLVYFFFGKRYAVSRILLKIKT